MLEKLEVLLDSLVFPDITIEELEQWKKDPVTKLLMAKFMEAYFINLELLSEMIPVDDEARASHAMAVGEQGVYKKVLDYASEVKGELKEKEEKSER